jgi:hypothetical protein
MLQPTQVDRVIPTCLGVLARFPTLHVDSTHLEEITAAGLHAEVKAGMIRLPEERASRGDRRQFQPRVSSPNRLLSPW